MFLNIFCLQKRECIFCFVEHVGIFRGQSMVFVSCRHVFYKLQYISDRSLWLTRVWGYFTSLWVFVFSLFVYKQTCFSFQTKATREQLDFVVMSCWYLPPTWNIAKEVGWKIWSNWPSLFLALSHSNTVPRCLWFMFVIYGSDVMGGLFFFLLLLPNIDLQKWKFTLYSCWFSAALNSPC